MAKDERQASGCDFWKGVKCVKKVRFGRDQSDPSIKNRASGRALLGRARVKQLLGKFVTSPWTGRRREGVKNLKKGSTKLYLCQKAPLLPSHLNHRVLTYLGLNVHTDCLESVFP
jgi:hypothetical protein